MPPAGRQGREDHLFLLNGDGKGWTNPSGCEPVLCPHAGAPALDPQAQARPGHALPAESGFTRSSLSKLQAPGFTRRPVHNPLPATFPPLCSSSLALRPFSIAGGGLCPRGQLPCAPQPRSRCCSTWLLALGEDPLLLACWGCAPPGVLLKILFPLSWPCATCQEKGNPPFSPSVSSFPVCLLYSSPEPFTS